MATIPLTVSIANGLAFGITFYALLKLLSGRITRTDWLLLVLSALSVARFRVAVGGVIMGAEAGVKGMGSARAGRLAANGRIRLSVFKSESCWGLIIF